jgi:hypothetical protein
MDILWHVLNIIISSLSKILEGQMGLSQSEAYQVSVEIIFALFVTSIFLLATYAPVSRKMIYVVIGVLWFLIFLALVT